MVIRFRNLSIALGVVAFMLLVSACSARPVPTESIPYPQPQDMPTFEQPAYPAPAQTQPTIAPAAAYPGPQSTAQPQATCFATLPDMLGPFYTPGAPLRSSVGQGYTLTGVVRSAAGCVPVPNAQIEFWMAGPDGEYADAYRATEFSDAQGAYTFTSHVPVAYENRPPHIHIKVTADGLQELITQHYPQPGQTEAVMDLVLLPK